VLVWAQEEGHMRLINAGPSGHGWHRLEAFLRCPHLYGLKYGHKVAGTLKRVENRYLVWGSLIHVALAHLHSPNQTDLYSPEDAIKVAGAEYMLPRLDPTLLPEIAHALAAYRARYSGDEGEETIAVEEVFEMDFEDYPYSARIDRVVELPNGTVIFEDYKTTGRITNEVMDRYTFDGQTIGHQILGRHFFGDMFAGVRISHIRRDGGQFKREMLPRVLLFERQFKDLVVDTEEAIKRMTLKSKSLDDFLCHPSQFLCRHPYSNCPAKDMCAWSK
jgi:hypothetical protein